MTSEKESLISLGKDVLVSLLILIIILGSLYAFSGRWPPMVVIESGSMMHSEKSQIGRIDPGDIVIVQESDREDITTYVEGKAQGYRKYGQYGDVIVFEPDGSGKKTPIIHRPVLYLEYNQSSHSFDIPSLEKLDYGEEWGSSQGNKYLGLTEEITLYDYGYGNVNVTINLQEQLRYRHSGYITMGDSTETNAPRYDQEGISGNINQPVKEEWIKGKARGELPWYGIVKLGLMDRSSQIPSNSWNNFVISLVVIISIPFVTEIGSNIYKKTRGEKSDSEENGPEKPPEETKEKPKEKTDEENEISDEGSKDTDVKEIEERGDDLELEQIDTDSDDLTKY